MSEKKKKVVKIVTYSYPPDATMASQRLRRITNGFLKLGWEVDVFSTAPSHLRSELKLGRSNPLHKVNVHRHNSLFIEVLLSLRQLLTKIPSIRKTGSYRLDKPNDNVKKPTPFKLFPDPYIFSARRIYVHDLIKRMGGRRADVVVASGPVFSSFLIAAHLSDRNNAPLVLDYRDPWTDSDYIKSRKGASKNFLNRELVTEVDILNKAALVTTVSVGLGAILAEKTDTDINVAYNSIPSSERDADILPLSELPEWMQAKDRFRIVYTGSLYGGRRDITPLIYALAQLNTQLIRQVDLIILGPDGALVEELVKREKMFNLNVVVDKVSHEQARAIQSYGDMLVLINWDQTEHNKDYILTGKLFEYEAAGKPIVAIGVNPTSELAKFVSKGSENLISNEPSTIERFIESAIKWPGRRNENDGKDEPISSAEDIASWCEYLVD